MAFTVNKAKKQKRYVDGELLIIKNNKGKLSLSEITKKINDEFGNNRTECGVEAKASDQGYPISGKKYE
jgi:hypothetical protein